VSTVTPSVAVKADQFFVTSDPHYSQVNICRGVSTWSPEKVNATRDFDTVDEMNAAIVNGINKTVPPDGVLFCLGDWSFGGRDQIAKFRQRLAVRTIHLILGNHDHHLVKSQDYNHLFTSVSRYKEIRVGKQEIILFHYGCRVWNASHKGSWLLYGHSHGSLPAYGRSMDVGVDTHPEFRPYTFAEVKAAIESRTIQTPDHHHANTD